MEATASPNRRGHVQPTTAPSKDHAPPRLGPCPSVDAPHGFQSGGLGIDPPRVCLRVQNLYLLEKENERSRQQSRGKLGSFSEARRDSLGGGDQTEVRKKTDPRLAARSLPQIEGPLCPASSSRGPRAGALPLGSRPEPGGGTDGPPADADSQQPAARSQLFPFPRKNSVIIIFLIP